MGHVRYAFWLQAAGAAQQYWATLIEGLSVRLGTPAFAPHVTLLAGLRGAEAPLRVTLRALALELEPFAAQLTQIKRLDEYYRCVFVEIESSRLLQHGHDAAQRRCAVAAAAPFYPHLSLVYGDLSPTAKQSLIEELGPRIDQPLRLTHLALIEVPDGPATWRCLERVPLGGDDSCI